MLQIYIFVALSDDMPDDQAIEEAIGRSVQTPHKDYYAAGLTNLAFWGEYGVALPSVYSPYRQALLARVATHPQASMWMGAVAGLTKEATATPWELKGKRRVNFFQDILLDSEYGAGWESMLQKLLWDFLNSDDGAYLQIIGRGDASKPLPRELVTGISVLSSAYCWPTGNPEFPIWYQDALTSEMHKLHWSRVVRFVDQPFSDPLLRGRGVCALSRAFAYVQQNITQNIYIGESMDKNPPPGLLIWKKGAKEAAVRSMWAAYNAARSQGAGGGVFGPWAEYINQADDVEVALEILKFSTAPEGFDPQKFEQMQATGIARALGIDPQDVLPVQGGSFGTNTQARVLDKKGSGKMLAHIYKMLERALNIRVLPDPVKFTFKSRDTEQSQADANIANAHLSAAASLAALPGVPEDAALRYIAATVPAMADILLDENGELRFAYDDDVDAGATPVVEASPADGEQMAGDADDQVDGDAPIMDGNAKALFEAQRKNFEDVAGDFRNRFAPVVFEINDGGIDASRRADSIVRSILRNEGMKAMLQGMKDGGVDVKNLAGDDLKEYTKWWGETSRYITNLVSRLFGYGEGRIERSEAAVRQTIDLWAGKSLRDAYTRGLMRADADGMYRWKLGRTEKHCADCKRLDGQVHRLSTYAKAGAVPGSSKLACWGGNCDCRLEKTTGKERGTIVLSGKREWLGHIHTSPVPRHLTAHAGA